MSSRFSRQKSAVYMTCCFVIIALVAVAFWGCGNDDDGDGNGNGDTKTFQQIWYPFEIGHQWKYEYQPLDTTTVYLTETVIGDTIIDSGKLFIKRNDYTGGYTGTDVFYWRVDSEAVWLLWELESDTVHFCSFPFVENEWQFTDTFDCTDTLGIIIGYMTVWNVPSYGHSVNVPAGNYDNCWLLYPAWVTYDTIEGTVDTISVDDPNAGFYFAQNIGNISSGVNMYNLVSFETGVNVDTLSHFHGESGKQKFEYDRLGHLIFRHERDVAVPVRDVDGNERDVARHMDNVDNHKGNIESHE